MRRPARLALLAGLLLSQVPVLEARAQGGAAVAEMRDLRAAEAGLREVLKALEEGRLASGAAVARLRAALVEVEHAMQRLPDGARRGTTWQTAVQSVGEAMAAVRSDDADVGVARAIAGEALATLTALVGADPASPGG